MKFRQENDEAGPVGAESGFENVTAPLSVVTVSGYSEKRNRRKPKAKAPKNGGPATRSAAIAAKCRDCIFDSQAAGTWRQQITVCPATNCALWRFRPLAEGIASCFKSRSADDLPQGWQLLPQSLAIRLLEPSKQGIRQGMDGSKVSTGQSDIEAAGMPNLDSIRVSS